MLIRMSIMSIMIIMTIIMHRAPAPGGQSGPCPTARPHLFALFPVLFPVCFLFVSFSSFCAFPLFVFFHLFVHFLFLCFFPVHLLPNEASSESLT